MLALLPAHPKATADTVAAPFQKQQLAVAVLLLELAQADRSVPPRELAAVDAVLRRRFGLDAPAAGNLLEAAQKILAAALEDWVFAKMVRESFGREERVAIATLLWEIVYADGRLARLEKAAIEHIGRELGIADTDMQAARDDALARIEDERRAGGIPCGR